jgi:predicted nucleotidyltransferase
MNKADIIYKLKQLKPELARKYGLTALALFGSYSREEQKPDSDIDLLIDLKTPNADYFFDCAFALQDSFKDKTVEIVTAGAIKPKYLEAIKPDLVYV